MAARSAGALTQLLLLAGAPADAEARAVWLRAVGSVCACVDALRAHRADEREVVEQGLQNLLLCSAPQLAADSETRIEALALVRASRCAPETVDAVAGALEVADAASADGQGPPGLAGVPPAFLYY
ncbi:hypothetical protein T492DRAFT_979937 [Pavlovales sp. CCMP2436]|nr:hypothetical protein T492DRAFT_979937 [Pavlovales sp. CCMP2436]